MPQPQQLGELNCVATPISANRCCVAIVLCGIIIGGPPLTTTCQRRPRPFDHFLHPWEFSCQWLDNGGLLYHHRLPDGRSPFKRFALSHLVQWIFPLLSEQSAQNTNVQTKQNLILFDCSLRRRHNEQKMSPQRDMISRKCWVRSRCFVEGFENLPYVPFLHLVM